MTSKTLGDWSATPVDVEEELVSYLRDTTGMSVSTAYPKDITPEIVEPFIVLSTVSSTIKNVVVQRTILYIDCFGSSTVEASKLAGQVTALLSAYNRFRVNIVQAPMQVGRNIDLTAACFSMQVAVTVKAHPTRFVRKCKQDLANITSEDN